jgi:outer membrane protein assembly factor BamB
MPTVTPSGPRWRARLCLVAVAAAGCNAGALPALDRDGSVAPADLGPGSDLGAPSLGCPGFGLQPGAPWPMTGRCPDHAGRSPTAGPRRPRVRWSFPTADQVYSSVAVAADGTVYCGSSDHHLYAIDGRSGARRWDRELDTAVGAPAIGADGAVFVGEYTGAGSSHVYALEPQDGRTRWRYPVFDGLGPTIDSRGWVYFAQAETVVAFRGDNGDQKGLFSLHGGLTLDPLLTLDDKLVGASVTAVEAQAIRPTMALWRYSTAPDQALSSLASTADGTIVVGTRMGALLGLSPGGGLRWRASLGAPIVDTPAIASDGTIVVSVGQRLVALRPSAQPAPALLVPLWTYAAGTALAAPIVDLGRVYVGGADGALRAIDTRDGTLAWSLPVGGSLAVRPAIGADGTIYLGSSDHRLYAISETL